jgi:hypothetical protein
MSEQAPQSEDTPTVDTPQGTGTPSQQIPEGYIPEDRYKEAQAWGTRVAQEKALLEQRIAGLDDPDQFRALMAERGYQIEDSENDDTLYARTHLPPLQTPQGPVPDLQGALKSVQEFVLSAAEMPEVRGQLLKGWQGTKTTTHRVSPVGEAGTQQPDLSTTEGKTAHILGRMAAEEQ